ncbi:MAG: hypothetical protein WCP21_17605 [Armatimonadota bacterium]
MTRKAIIAALRSDLDAANRDLWQLAEEVHIQKAETVRLQAIVDKQDLTILALWSLIDQQADEAPSDCALSDKGCRDGEPACTASYAEGCGAYLSKEKS